MTHTTSTASRSTPPPDPTAFTFAITIVTQTPVPAARLDEVLTQLGDAATNLIARTTSDSAIRTVATDWTRHSCALAPTDEGGDLAYVAHYGAPGIGQEWRCVRCRRSSARVAGVFHDPADGAHILRPEDVI
jgi:hypothetical protein